MPPPLEQAGDSVLSGSAAWQADDPQSQLRLALDALEGRPVPQAEQLLQWTLGHLRDAVVLRHDLGVTSISFDPQGRWVATGGRDRRVNVWDAASGDRLVSFAMDAPPRLRSNGPRFDQSGSLLLIATFNGLVFLVPWQQGVLPPPHPVSVQTRVSRAALGRQFLATGHDNGTVRVTPLDNPDAPIVLIDDPSDDVISSVAVSPNSRHVAAGTRSGRIWLFDVSGPNRPMALAEQTDWVNQLLFSADSTRLASANDDHTANIYAVADGHLQAELRLPDRVNAVAFNRDATRLVTMSVNKTAVVFDTSSGNPLHEVVGATDELVDGKYSPNGRLLATVGADGHCRISLTGSGKTLYQLRHDGPIEEVAWAPDSKSVATASFDRTARVWNMDMGVVLPHPREVNHVAFSRDCENMASSCEDGRVRVFRVDTGELLAVVAERGGAANSAAFNPDGRLLAIARQDGTATVVEWATAAKVIKLPHAFEVEAVAFSSTGNHLVTSTRREITVWDWQNSQPLVTMGPSAAERAADPYAAIIWSDISPDGSLAVSAHYNERARLWNAQTGAPAGELPATGIVYNAMFGETGGLVIAGCGDGRARLYDPATRELRHKLVSPSGQLRGAALSRSGELAAGAGLDGSITIWKVRTEQVLCVANQHAELATSVVFCGDRLVASTSDDGTLRLLDVGSCRPPEELLAAARDRTRPVSDDQ